MQDPPTALLAAGRQDLPSSGRLFASGYHVSVAGGVHFRRPRLLAGRLEDDWAAGSLRQAPAPSTISRSMPKM